MIAPAAEHRRFSCDDVFLIQSLTLQAAKQIARLAEGNRRKVESSLSRPIRFERCKLLQRLARQRVYRLTVDDSLRVTFRLVAGNGFVLHVGTHQESDRFVYRYDGSLPGRLLPIQGAATHLLQA
jgi:hypothetical protein